MTTRTYNPKKVIITFLGQTITGYADGTFADVELTSDAFTMQIGSDGEPARVASADESGTIKFTLMQTSASNDVLSAAHAKDRLTNLNTGSLFIKDASGRTLVSAGEAWIKKFAKVEFGKDAAAREWTIESGKIDVFVGGN